MAKRTLSAVIGRPELVLIDLDDTIFSEVEYLFAAYDEIDRSVASKQPNLEAGQFSKFLRRRFLEKGRSELFQEACLAFNVPDQEVAAMLTTLRRVTVQGGLRMFNDIEGLIRSFSATETSWCVVTNGDVGQQRNKIRQLVPTNLVTPARTYFCDQYARKPAPDAVLAACADHNVSPSGAIFIGDSHTDELAAHAAGVDYLNIVDFRAQK